MGVPRACEERPVSSKPRIIENVQLVPPRRTGAQLPAPTQGDWSQVASRKRKRGKRRATQKEGNEGATTAAPPMTNPPRGTFAGTQPSQPSSSQPPTQRAKPVSAKEEAMRLARRRVPRSDAVAIQGAAPGYNYADALKRAREKISLPELGIAETRIRRTANGGVLIEIPDKENRGLANRLAAQIQAVLGEEARVTKPTVKGELRVSGFDDSVSKSELVDKLAELGGCRKEELRLGTPSRAFNGLHSVWAQCPLEAAIRIADKEKFTIGWTVARVQMLKNRPSRCFRCWETGHLQSACKSPINRSRSCFNCGEEGHALSQCGHTAKCVLCHAKGEPSDHRLGTSRCTEGKAKVGGGTTNPVTNNG